jgi:hypothetical protein
MTMSLPIQSTHETTAKAVADRGIFVDQRLSTKHTHPVSFKDEWDDFIAAVQRATNRENVGPLSDADAWENHFGPVIRQRHGSEMDFSDALFGALRTALTGFCEPPNHSPKSRSETTEVIEEVTDTSDESTRIQRPSMHDKEIRLIDSNVGFATQVYRNKRLGFPDNYGASTDRIVDHACVVFRYDEEEIRIAAKKRKSGMECSVVQQKNTNQHYDDVTCAVVLKHAFSSCKNFGHRPEACS